MKRAIHILPDTSHVPEIETIRQRFDWLQSHIRAHVTLVFPFDLPVSDEDLIHHCRACTVGIAPFSLLLQAPQQSVDDHVWLPVVPAEPLATLTRRLYTGPLACLHGPRSGHQHHITIARPPLSPAVLAEIQRCSMTFPIVLNANALTLEAIHPNHASLELGCFAL